jgi:trehalose synthase
VRQLREVPVVAQPLDRFVALVGPEPLARARAVAERLIETGRGRVIWNISSTPAGGGVAELLRSVLAYGRGAGVDVRWLVIEGDLDFFRITKRLHNALHGAVGDGSPLEEPERQRYQAVLDDNGADLLAWIRPGDVVILHDPQTAGLASWAARAGARTVWRCHIGTDRASQETERGWRFLLPALVPVEMYVFSRAQFVPAELAERPWLVIPPSIDPFSAKNRPLSDAQVQAILMCTGLIQGAPPCAACFERGDGTTSRTRHMADVLRLGPPPRVDTPLVVQISRWDALKDPVGVLRGFVRLLERQGQRSGERSAGSLEAPALLLAGPTVHSVADDPDGARIFGEVTAVWRTLPHEQRSRVHLANLPMRDLEENAAIVNALQRHAAIIVQKSLDEGFGLTVTEAMWKGRPIVASAVGGIRDQLDTEREGLLIEDPRDLESFALALERLSLDPALGQALGARAHARVVERSLALRTLLQYGELLARLDESASLSGAAAHPGSDHSSLATSGATGRGGAAPLAPLPGQG